MFSQHFLTAFILYSFFPTPPQVFSEVGLLVRLYPVYGATAGHDGAHAGFTGVQHTTTGRPPPDGIHTIQDTAEATTRRPPPSDPAIKKENTAANAGPLSMGGRPDDCAGAPGIMPPPNNATPCGP
jgi:hypothetical protein